MSLGPPHRMDKMCFVYCGDDRCNCQSGDPMRARRYKPFPPKYTFEVGDKVLKHTGDYKIYGEVRGHVIMKNGAIRFVVEHDSVPEGSFLHIYSEKNLKKVEE